MNCDFCRKLLTEADTNESILCTRCMNSRETLHCARCACLLKAHKKYKKFVALLKKQRKVFYIAGGIAAFIGCVIPFWPILALKLAMGFIGLPIALTIFIIGTYYVGKFVVKVFKFDIDLERSDDK